MALQFDGVDDQVSHGDIDVLDTPSAFTIALWVSVNESAVATNDGYFGKSSTGATNGFCTLVNSGGFGYRFFIDATAFNKTVMFADTAYHYLTVVFDGAGAANADRLKVYLDGVSQTATNYTGTVPTAPTTSGTAAFIVGRAASDLGWAPFTGSNLRVWTAALSSGQIATEMDSDHAVLTTNLLIDAPYGADGTDVTGNHSGAVTGTAAAAGPPVSGEIAIGAGAYAITGTDVEFELASSTTGGLVFDYVLSQESSEAIWPSRMTQMADWAVPAYLSGERVVLYTKSGSNQIWVLGNDTTGTITSYIDLPWMSRLDDTKVTKWLGLVAPYSSTVAVDVYVRYANNPGEFDAASWTLRGTLPANPTIAEGARIVFGGSTRWVQVRFRADTIAAGGFELFPPVHMIPVDTMRSPN